MAKKQMENNKKSKRPAIPRWLWYTALISAIAALVCSFHLIARWCINTIYTVAAGNGLYIPVFEEMLTGINFPEGYKVWYNIGNYHFQKGDYKQAENDYYKAIVCGIPYEKECPVKINLALATINELSDDEWEAFFETEDIENDPKALTVQNALLTAKTILIEDGCAHDEDENGHDEQAQILKDEIEELLKNAGGGGEGSDDDQGGEGSDSQEENNDENDGDQGQSMSEREENIKNSLQNFKDEVQDARSEERQELQDWFGDDVEDLSNDEYGGGQGGKDGDQNGEGGEGGDQESDGGGGDGGSEKLDGDPKEKNYKIW